MHSELANFLALGDHYTRSQQTNNAALAYERSLKIIYSDLGSGEEVDLAPYTHDDLVKFADGPVAVAGLQQGSVLAKLREVQSTAHGEARLLEKAFIIVFKCPHTRDWTIIYQDREDLLPTAAMAHIPEDTALYGDGRVPTGKSYCFVLQGGPQGFYSVALSDREVSLIAYCLAHSAQAGVRAVEALYYEHQILPESSTAAVMDAARSYDLALCFAPQNSWALAHLGEVYRGLANGWPGNERTLYLPNGRVMKYVVALAYYGRALEINPEAFWAHAHLGAAIINVRAFLGAYFGAKNEVFDGLLKGWFPDVKSPEERYDALLDRAGFSLAKAQLLMGNYYPWAEAYYSGVFLLKAAGTSGTQSTVDYGMLSMILTQDAAYLQSTTVTQGFEPGEVYVNGFFQMGLIYLWRKKASSAWDYVHLGMGRLFKFNFLPGLQATLGFQIFVNISAGLILGEPESGTSARMSEVKLCAPKEVMGISIPETPISNPGRLVDFMNEVFEKSCLPTIAPALRPGIVYDTNVQMGMIQAYFILVNFRVVLRELTSAPKEQVSALGEALGHCMDEIAQHMSFMPKTSLDDYGHHMNDMFAFLNTGKPSHAMMSELKSSK